MTTFSKSTEELPVDLKRSAIMSSSAKYNIIIGETGSGKTTRLPIWCLEAGESVLAAEPLIETVVETSNFLATSIGSPLGKTIGYRTGLQKLDSRETRILFATDGLIVIRQVSGHNQFDNLIIDELHQWNTSQAVLEAWVWQSILDGTCPFNRVFVLSADMEAEELSRARGNEPIFRVDGRQFPIEDRQPGISITQDVIDLVAEGCDVIVFEPGIGEINNRIKELRSANIDADVFPFMGWMGRSDKDKALQFSTRPRVIVSTNALESGVTVVPSPGRRLAVVDSGLERRVELVEGVETIVLKPISLAQESQRRGRAGRVGNGIFITHLKTKDRTRYPVPEILRTRLDQTVLRLLCEDVEPSTLPFFHSLDPVEIERAKSSLKLLGAITEQGAVTKLGRKMARLPVAVHFARMIVEAQRRGVVSDLVDLIALMETKGIRFPRQARKWGKISTCRNSDLLVELDLFRASLGDSDEKLISKGIRPDVFKAVMRSRLRLKTALRQHKVKFVNTGTTEELIKSCLSGLVENLYVLEGGAYARPGEGKRYQLGVESVVSAGSQLIAAMTSKSQIGSAASALHMVTETTAEQVAGVAPQLVVKSFGHDAHYDGRLGVVRSTTRYSVAGQVFKEKLEREVEHPDYASLFIEWLVDACFKDDLPWILSDEVRALVVHNREIISRARSLNARAGKEVFVIPGSSRMKEMFLGKVELSSGQFKLWDLRLPHLHPDKVEEVHRNYPDVIQVLGVGVFPVVYASGRPPVLEYTGDWTKLPDEGISFPNGEKLLILVKFENACYGPMLLVPSLKLAISEVVIPKLFDQWEKPSLPIPNFASSEAEIPGIEKATYGVHPLTEEQLIANGVLVRNSNGFEWQWFRDLSKAEQLSRILPDQVDDFRKGGKGAGSASQLTGLFGGNARVVKKK